MKISHFLLVLVSTLSLLSCSPPSSEMRLILTGSSTVAPLAAEIGKRFESLHPEIRVDVQTGGSSRGIADVRRDLAQIGMASRALKPAESDLTFHTIARDGICIIVHKDNGAPDLTDQQIRDIFTGKIQNWREVGGEDRSITVVNKAEGRSTLELFLKFFDLENTAIKADVVIGDNVQGIKTVSGNVSAIGYVSIGTAEYDAGHGSAIRLMSVGGVKASIENVRNHSFPLARPLNLVTSKAPEGWTKQFIDFAQSDQVYDIVQEQYFVPITQ